MTEATHVQRLLMGARTSQGLTSNYALARLLDVREKDVSRWWNGHNIPAATMILRLAELAKVDPAAVLPAIEAQRAQDEGVRAVWQRLAHLAERGAAVASLALLVLGVGVAPDARAADAPGASGGSVYYVNSLMGRLLRLVRSAYVLALGPARRAASTAPALA